MPETMLHGFRTSAIVDTLSSVLVKPLYSLILSHFFYSIYLARGKNSFRASR